MNASSFRAGMMADTVAAEGAGMKAPWAETFCSPVAMVYGMRKWRFATQVDCAMIAFDGNPQKNGGLGSGRCGGAGCGLLCHAFVPPRRSLHRRQEGPGLPGGDRREAGASHRSEKQGRRAEFLGHLVSAVRRGNSGPEPFAQIHRGAQRSRSFLCLSPGPR